MHLSPWLPGSVEKKVFDFGILIYEYVHFILIFYYLYLSIQLNLKCLTNKAPFLNIIDVKCN